MTASQRTDYDLIVIGGGPGGAACATFVAMQKHRVLLLEKSPIPTHKIGESLLPVTIRGICSLLGVTEQIKKASFVTKTGGRFVWGRDREPWDFFFSPTNDVASSAGAYQVEREVFDGILLRNAVDQGVDVRLGHIARKVITGDDGRATGLQYLDAEGVARTATARFIVDASGQSGCLSDFVGRRIYSEFFRNMSIYRYYQGGKRLPEPVSGNVLSVAFEHGWFWYIPLRNGLTSVGVVFGREGKGRSDRSIDDIFDSYVAQCPEIRDLLSGAERSTAGNYSRTRVSRDFSYTSSRFYNNGVALIGDAACFLDPLFSSGVHLTTFSALLAARSINTRLRGLSCDRDCFAEYEIRYRQEFAKFYDFISAFYDVHHQESAFWMQRKVSASPEKRNAEYMTLLYGDSGHASGEQADPWTDRVNLGAILFPGATGRPIDSDSVRQKRSSLLGSLFSELTRLQLQAMLQEKRPLETPIRAGGLIPSSDGMHWSSANTPIDDLVAVI